MVNANKRIYIRNFWEGFSPRRVAEETGPSKITAGKQAGMTAIEIQTKLISVHPQKCMKKLKRNTNLVLIMLLNAPLHTAVFRSIPNVVQVNL